jgi:hypothetical protein
MTRDEQDLRMLSIFHYVVGGLSGLFALFPVIYLVIGLGLIFTADKFNRNGHPPAFVGWLFVVFAVMAIILGLVIAAFILTTGRFLAWRKHYTFCLVIGCIECLLFPFGTILGVFTIMVLVRDSVKQLFVFDPNTSPKA